jgi:two-component system alkaline phosphatase synthesis response regulator PhoP
MLIFSNGHWCWHIALTINEKEQLMPMLLLVDDEKNIVELERLYLEKEGYKVEAAYDGHSALEKFRSLKPSAVILDLMLPVIDGWEVCRRIRQESDVPILMLTARDQDIDKIVGLELGADDYLTKPFNPRELVARVKAIFRRVGTTPKAQRVSVGDITIDLDRREVMAADRLLQLRTKEFDLLAVLMQNPGIVLTRERLLQVAWGYDFAGETRTVDVHVAHLRKKLGNARTSIETVSGVGYKLVEIRD